MKIAHIQHPYIPNMGYQENHLPNEQQKLGHKVKIFSTTKTPSDRGKQNKFDSGEYIYDNIKVKRSPPIVYIKNIENCFIRNLFWDIDRFNPDVIHSHGMTSPYTLQVCLYALLKDQVLVVDDHIDDNNFNIESLAMKAAFETYKNIFLPPMKKSINHYLPITNYSKSFLIKELDIDESKISLLPLGVNTDQFYPMDVKSINTPFSGKLKSTDFVIITSGHIEREKNIQTLLDSMEHLLKENINVKLIIAGSGDSKYIRKLKDNADIKGISEKIIFTGHVNKSQLRKLFNMSDIGVWPGIGVSIIEGMATGLPILIGDYKATRHLIENNNGHIFEPNDADQLQELLKTFANDQEKLERFSDNSYEYVKSALSWENIAKDSIKIYMGQL